MTHNLPAALYRVANHFESSPWASAATVLREIWGACDDKGPLWAGGESRYLENVDLAYQALAAEAGCDLDDLPARLEDAYHRGELPGLLRAAAGRIQRDSTDRCPQCDKAGTVPDPGDPYGYEVSCPSCCGRGSVRRQEAS